MKRWIFFLFISGFLLGMPAVLFADTFSDDNLVAPVLVQDEFLSGTVVEITEEGARSDLGTPIFFQELRIRIQEGGEEGFVVPVTYEKEETLPGQLRYTVGDKVVLDKQTVGAEVTYYISDTYRLHWLWALGIIFFILAILFARWFGVRAIVGLGMSFFVIIFFLLPQILAGKHPALISFIAAVLIASLSLFIAHGFTRRTAIAFASMLIVIVISLGLGWGAIQVMSLFGLGTEEAFYLQFSPGVHINLQGLLFGGIIIGILGVLDDVTTAQAAAVEEIHLADPSLSFAELYRRGSSVGREHIVSLVNTLVLAYTGASLPLLLLFRVYERPAWVVLNSEIVMEEMVRMLVGSIALVLAVPLTTFLAARYVVQKRSV